jgi:hypothetical protein
VCSGRPPRRAVLRTPESLRCIASELRLDRVIIAPPSIDGQALAEIVRVVEASGIRVNRRRSRHAGRGTDPGHHRCRRQA